MGEADSGFVVTPSGGFSRFTRLVFYFLAALTFLPIVTAIPLVQAVGAVHEELFNCQLPHASSTRVEDKKVEKFCDQLRKDLERLGSLRFKKTSQLHRTFFGTEPDSVLKFVLKDLKSATISIDEYIEACQRDGNWVPCPNQQAAGAANNTLTLWPLFFEQSEAFRLSALAHEARHLVGDHHHVNCPNPYVWSDGVRSIPNPEVAGALSCDDKFDGSYGYGFVLLRSIVNSCENCNPELVADAEKLSTPALLRISDPSAAKILIRGTQP